MTVEGLQLGKYRIIEKIGVGGMADVYRAEDTELGRVVALKLLPPEFARDEERARRFDKEVRAAAALSHANIVTLYDVSSADGYHFYTMDLISGGDLKQKIRDGLSPEAVLQVMREIGSALAHAHARGFVHRDLKPENILFREDGSAVLTDFGIARAIGSGTRMTKTGMSIGTPHYMSPEQARGKTVDHRSDLYSLGILFYEMLTGKVPYDAEETFAVGYMHINDPIPELPANQKKYQPVIDTLLAKEPADRYADASAMLAALERVDSGRAISRPIHATRVMKASENTSPKDYSGLKWGAAGAVLALVIGIAVYFSFYQGTPFSGPGAGSTRQSSTVSDASPGSTAVAQSQKKSFALTKKQEPEAEVEDTGTLTVNPEPSDALVRILNIGPKYRDNMELKPGRYHVEVSKAGYVKQERWVELPAGKDLTVSMALRKQEKTGFTDPTTDMEFVAIPAGCFPMGSPAEEGGRESDEGPVHEVCVDGFAMGKYEVTVGQWRRFIQATGYRTEAERNVGEAGCYGYKDNKWEWQDGYYWDNVGFSQSSSQPVACVSHNDVAKFIDWLSRESGRNYRLPTEAEWEYAARGGTLTSRYWGDYDGNACGYANVADKGHGWNRSFPCDDGHEYSAPMGEYKPNGFGLHDMLGNVWEWTGDWYDDDYYKRSPRRNPTGPGSGVNRVNRGGGWCVGPAGVRSANRSGSRPWSRDFHVGFRLVLPFPGQ